MIWHQRRLRVFWLVSRGRKSRLMEALNLFYEAVIKSSRTSVEEGRLS